MGSCLQIPGCYISGRHTLSPQWLPHTSPLSGASGLNLTVFDLKPGKQAAFFGVWEPNGSLMAPGTK